MAVSKSTAVATSAPAAATLADVPQQKLMLKLATKYGVDETKMLSTLKATAFKQRGKKNPDTQKYDAPIDISNEQMMMLAVVADQYGLNPFTREIYAFPSENGIVAVVSVDGWIRIINERPELLSIEFEIAPPGTEDPWITCTITRRDRTKPLAVTEYLSECSRNTDPWKEMPRRMLRHKALIQCARVAFGFAGVYDPDEADRIVATVERREAQLTSGKSNIEEPKRLSEKAAAAISMDMMTTLKDKLKEEGVAESLLCARYSIGSLSELPEAFYREAIATIDELSKDAGNGSG